MKTTAEAFVNLRAARRELIAALLQPFSRCIKKCTAAIRRTPAKIAFWASKGVPKVFRESWRAWRFEIDRQRCEALHSCGQWDEYFRAKRELRRKWGI